VFYKAYYNHQSVQIYQQEITGSETLLKAYQQQFSLGNVAQKDIIRIQSLLINLKAELKDLQNELEDNYRDLKIFCNINANTDLLLILDTPENISVEKITYNTLIDSARNNRGDYKLAKSTLQFSEANLKLQKALAIPDLQLSLTYDLKGNYPEKYTGLGVRIPIPLFNRNQGEIKKAKIGIEVANSQLQSYETILENEVLNSYRTALRTEQQYQAIDPKFSSNFNQLMAGMSENFKNRNISLIEFLDFYSSYKESALKLNQLKYERLSTREEINFVTGTQIFK
jgi:cobalt-zinc-cadmium efflux system outer membrane protein